MESWRLWSGTTKLTIASASSFLIMVYILAPDYSVLNQTTSMIHGIISSSHDFVAGTTTTKKNYYYYYKSNSKKFEGPVQELIERLHERTKLVRAYELDPPSSYSPEEEKKIWELENPCSAREGLVRRYRSRTFAKDVEPNPAWQQVFEAYTDLHRACIRRIGNVTGNFYSRTTTVPECHFVVGESYTGLGNKMLVVSSTLLFAILTERVFLVPTNTRIPDVFCEPFEGSSWEIDDEMITDLKTKGPWTQVMDTFDWVDQQVVAENMSELHNARVHNNWQPLTRFYCDTEQAFLTQVPWIQIAGCLHFLPRLFTIPKFRPILEVLFPDRMALTHILRSAMLPSDPVWERILNVDQVYLEHTERQIGVQVRYFNQNIKDKINSRVADCCIENDLLPKVHPFATSTSTSNTTDSTSAVRTVRTQGQQHRRITKVFIASLLPDVHDFLNQKYLRHKTVGDVGVGLVQLSHENTQRMGSEVDSEALVEIICLSISDHILVTPKSTFGGIAQAYGALIPWFINFDGGSSSGIPPTVNCQRGQSVGVCFQKGPQGYDCKYDASLKGHSLFDDFPYLQPCLAIDTSGIQLITSHADVM